MKRESASSHGSQLAPAESIVLVADLVLPNDHLKDMGHGLIREPVRATRHLTSLPNFEALRDRDFVPPTLAPPHPDYDISTTWTSRNNFLFIIEENGAIYEAVRGLIDDEEYWRKEDGHFMMVNSLILDPNHRQGHEVSLAEAVCPPVEVIKQMFCQLQATRKRHNRRTCSLPTLGYE